MLKKVIVFGTFDIFHPGHRDFFRQAKKFGDFLVVVVARDKNVRDIKGIYPKNNEERRLSVIRRCKLVNKAVLGNENKNKIISTTKKYCENKNTDNSFENKITKKDYKYKILQEEKPDVICLGYDQKVDEKELQKKLKEYKIDKVKVVRLKPYKEDIYKSSLLLDN